MTRQRYQQLRRAVEQGRAVAAVVIPRVPIQAWDMAAFLRNYDDSAKRMDDLDASDNRGGLDERAKVARNPASACVARRRDYGETR